MFGFPGHSRELWILLGVLPVAAAALTTGRLRLPAPHDYLFSVWSVTSNVYPRYRGGVGTTSYEFFVQRGP